MDQSQSATSSVPYPYLTPIDLSSSAQHLEDVQKLSLLLDVANRKIDNDTHLIASLYTELKQYRDTICGSCKRKVLLANAGMSPQLSGVNPNPSHTAITLRRDTIAVPSNPSSPVLTSPVEIGTKVPSPLDLSPLARSSSDSSLKESSTHSDVRSSHAAFQSILDQRNTTPGLQLSPTLMSPLVSVDYNPVFKKRLKLSLVKIFTFTAFPRFVTFSRDGKYFGVALQDGETHIYDIITMSKSILREYGTSVVYSEAMAATKQRSRIWSMRFSPDSKYIATGEVEGQIKIWETKRKRLCAIFSGHTSVVGSIDFSPDGRFLASASWDNTVRIWRLRDGSSKLLSPSVDRDFNSVVFSPDGQYVAAGQHDGHLMIWDARTGRLLKMWKGHTDIVRCVAFHPDGKEMASGGNDGTWKKWDLGSLQGNQLQSSGHVVGDELEKEVFTCRDHTRSLISISFSCDGRWVATLSDDCTLRILDATTGAWLCTPAENFLMGDFSPAGQYLVTGCTDRRVMLWEYHEQQ